MAALLGPVFMLSSVARAEPVREDLTKVYESGRTAFNKGDLAKAKIAFAKVLKAKPDFDLAIIYMAQIKHAEAKWEARPRSQKIAEKATVALVVLSKVTLADALEVVRREVEKAGGGPAAGAISLLTDLPPEMLEQPVELTVRDAPMMQFIDSVGFAGNVRIAWHDRGLSVTTNAMMDAAADPAMATAARSMKQLARERILPNVQMQDASVREAIGWLTARIEPSQGPMIVVREPAGPARVTLNLRNVPLSEAINSVALIAGLEVSWHPWGAGLSTKNELAVHESTPAPQQP